MEEKKKKYFSDDGALYYRDASIPLIQHCWMVVKKEIGTNLRLL